MGEVHHPIEPHEIPRPGGLSFPSAAFTPAFPSLGLSGAARPALACTPFAQQLLSWAADDPRRRAAALVLEVKGDFCYSIRKILQDAGRGDDYLEIGLGGSWQWNPLDDPDFDSYSLAYTVSTLLNQLFGKIEGALLAAGLHQPGPLDHRASPDHARRLGDAERHLPLRH